MRKLKDLRMRAREIVEQLGYDPVTTLAEIARDSTAPTVLWVQAATALLPYVHPKLEHLSISGTEGEAPRDSTSNRMNEILMRNPAARRMIEEALIEAMDGERSAQTRPLLVEGHVAAETENDINDR
jgi:hypothetical protein